MKPIPTARKARSRRSRRGGVALMALIIAIVTVVLFHAYLDSINSDQAVGESLDAYQQYSAERVAIERAVKESILEYYEQQRFSQDGGQSVQTKLQNLLNDMAHGSTSFIVNSVTPTLPASAPASFYPAATGSAGTNIALDTGNALQLAATPPADFSRVDDFLSPAYPALQVIHNSGSAAEQPIYTFVIQRTGLPAVTYTVRARLWQVPVTDFNLVAYAKADAPGSLPAAGPALTADITSDIQAGTLSALCATKMSVPNGLSDASGVAYPFFYRELFSASSVVWEWVNNEFSAANSYLCGAPYNLFTATNQPGIHRLLDTGIPTVGAEHVPSSDGTTFEPGIVFVGDHQNPTDPTSPYVAGSWEIDPAAVENTTVDPADCRLLYIYLSAAETPYVTGTSGTRIRFVSSGGSSTKPLFIWIDGRDRAGPDYPVVISGDFSATPTFIYTTGCVIVPEYGTTPRLNGALVLGETNTAFANPGDYLGSATAGTLTLDGTFAWNGATSGGVGSLVNLDNGGLILGAGNNPFRPWAPRFVVVDTQSYLQFP